MSLHFPELSFTLAYVFDNTIFSLMIGKHENGVDKNDYSSSGPAASS